MKLGWYGSRVRATAGWVCALMFALTMLPMFVSAAEIPVDAKGLPLWAIKEWTDFPVRLELQSKAELDRLLEIVPIASFNREQISLVDSSSKHSPVVFEPRITEVEAAALTDAGYSFERLEDVDRLGREAVERAWAERYASGFKASADKAINYYPTMAEMESLLADIAAAYPNLARTFTWGSSVQGRDLLGIVVSNNVNLNEAEPEVRYSATMHGDEPVGTIMEINFAQYLTEHYGETGYEDVTYLMDNYELHLMVMYNPDGYILDQRYNANNVDLNRNFALPAGTHTTQEIETTNFMNYGTGQHFVISINFHGGALVVNYPWDYTYDLSDDNDALIKLSLEYSTHNLPMYNSSSFDQGITNGAAWYITTGCLQDWSYDQTGCIDVTTEISNTKWPSASTLPTFWEENRESMMHHMKAARYGVNGIVTGSDTGLPLDALVTVTGNEMTVRTDPEHGDYYKLLDTGTYELTFSADGYIPQTFSSVSTTWGTPTVLNVQLNPVAHGDVTGVVADLGGTGLDAQVRVYSLPTETYVTTVNASAASGGAYSAHLVYGDYRLDAIASGYVTQSNTVTIGATPQVVNFSMPVSEEVVVFSDDFEGDLSQWTGGWGLASPAEGHDSANCLNDSPGDSYEDYEDNPMAMAAGLNLSTAMSGDVTFWARWKIEDSFDACFLEVSTDGGSGWTPLSTLFTHSGSGQGIQTPSGTPCFEDEQTTWVQNTVDLAPYLGETDVRFRFRLASDMSIHKEGFYLDDFVVTVVREQEVPVPDAELLTARVAAWPNPFNPQTTIEFTNPRQGAVQLHVYDVQGRLVRTLVAETMTAGSHSVMWDGRDEAGLGAASGVYFARLVAGVDQAVTKVMLVK